MVSDVLILGVAGILGTLAAPILAKRIDYYYSEKKEKERKKIKGIIKQKNALHKVRKAIQRLTTCYTFCAQLEQKNPDEETREMIKKFALKLIGEVDVLSDELLYLSTICLTFKDTKKIGYQLTEIVSELDNFGELIEKNLESQRFTDNNLKEVDEAEKKLHGKIVSLLVTQQ